MNPLSSAYGRVAGLRRRWYARHPDRRRRLDRPVVSVGNLVVGGSGKTPVVAAIARLLQQSGERPVILSRGYGRRIRTRETVIVSDGARVLAPVDASGDEPQMLARALDGVPVVVAPDRYDAGVIAQREFPCTVMLLDDGFQHLRLARDADLLIVAPADLEQQVLPSGTLRESLGAARAADALLVAGTPEEAAAASSRLGVSPAFTLIVRHEPLRAVAPWGVTLEDAGDGPVVAVAGIARPRRFFDALRAAGVRVAAELTFRDHHWYSDADLRRIAAAAAAAGARLVVTTEKDAARLSAAGVASSAGHVWAYLPMRMIVEPPDAFAAWLLEKVAAARQEDSPGTPPRTAPGSPAS